jgi:hypothetical protein
MDALRSEVLHTTRPLRARLSGRRLPHVNRQVGCRHGFGERLVGRDLLHRQGSFLGELRNVPAAAPQIMAVTVRTAITNIFMGRNPTRRIPPYCRLLYQRPYPVSDVAQVRLVSDAMRSGICISLFHASQHASMMASYPSQTEWQRKLPRMNSQTFSMGFSSGA